MENQVTIEQDNGQTRGYNCGNSCNIRNCSLCQLNYCYHYASKIDPSYCVYCFHDIVLHDTTITKDVITKSFSGKKTFHRTMKARHLVFEGQDWMLAQKRITTLDDMEIGTAIEYHREILHRMMEEREIRRIQNNQKQIRKGLVFKSNSIITGEDSIGLDVQSSTVTTTKVTKTKIVASVPDPSIALKAIAAMLKAKGIPEDQIGAAILKMVGKK